MGRITPRPRDEVRIDFWDHVEGGDKPILFTVWGRVVAFHDDFITVDSWAYYSPAEPRDGNITTFTIVRSAIKEIHLRNRPQKARRKDS